MKKTLTLILCLCICFMLAGCGSSVQPPPQAKVNMRSYFETSKNSYELSFDYQDSYFLDSAKVFNKSLALLSYGASLATSNPTQLNSFFVQMGYDNIKISDSYYNQPSATCNCYLLAHKTMEDGELIAVDIRGFEYSLEWISNFDVGYEGNHRGFETAAREIYDALTQYIDEYYNNTKIKLWITGYSRGGALANVLSSIILTSSDITVSQDNMYVYTIEAPKGLTQESAIAYENVFNIINSADLVTYVSPTKYGAYRCGIDVDIYSQDVSNIVSTFDDEITLPKYQYKSPQEYVSPDLFIQEVITTLTEENSVTEYDMSTRTNFANNFEPTINYFISILFSLKRETLISIKDSYKDMNTLDRLSFLVDDGIYDYLNPFLQRDGIQYDNNEFKNYCSKITGVIKNGGINLMTKYMVNEHSLEYIIAMHFPEVNYALLLNYNK